MEKEIDVRLVEIIFLYPVDGELLFLVAQLFPFALCFGDILFGELRDAVEFIPEQVKLFVDGFLFLLVAIGNSHPFIVFDDTNMQGGIVGVRDDFYNPQRGKLVYEPEGFSDRPVEDVAPVAITKQAFASFTQAVFILAVVVECIRIIDFHQNFQESFYFSFLHVPVFYLLL